MKLLKPKTLCRTRSGLCSTYRSNSWL